MKHNTLHNTDPRLLKQPHPPVCWQNHKRKQKVKATVKYVDTL